MEKLKPKAIIFDMGSTLVEWETMSWFELSKLCAASARKYLKKNGNVLPDEAGFFDAFEKVKDRYREQAFQDCIEWTIPQATETLFKELNINFEPEMIDAFFDAYYQPVDKRLFVYGDAVETLERIKNRYGMIGLVSNTIFPERVHRKELKRFGIAPYLDFTIFSSTFGIRKPHPDIFYKACNMAGFAPSECVYIGDRYVEDVTGPASIGMPAILKVRQGREYPPEMLPETRRVESLKELGNHIEL